MKCPYCQKEIPDNAQACIHCWKDIPQEVHNNAMESIETKQPPNEATPLNKPDSLPDNLSAIWSLPDAELASAYHSSVVLRRIGMIMYLLPLLFILPFIFSPKMIMASLLLFVFYVPFLYPTAYVLRNVRSLKAQKRLSHIAVFSAICGGITIAIYFVMVLMNAVNNAYRAGYIAGGMLFVVISVILVLYVHRHIKNMVIFSDNPFSHAELKYVLDSRKQSDLGSKEYPAKYTYGKLARTAMFFCPLMYLLALSLNFAFVEELFPSLQGGKSNISQEDVQFAEDCVKQGNAALEVKDFAKAVDYFDKAAKLGHPEARLNLGIIYAEGLAGTADYEKAFNLLSKEDIIAAPIAKYYVGLLYYTGKGTQQDFKQAGQYLQASAQAGCKPAQDFLGYEDGKMPDYGIPLEDVLKRLWETNK